MNKAFKKISRILLVFGILTGIGELGKLLIKNHGSPQRVFVDHDGLSFDEILQLPNQNWVDKGNFFTYFGANPPIHWLHTRIKADENAGPWSVMNNFGWYRKVDFYYQRDGKVEHIPYTSKVRTVFPRAELNLAKGEELDVYVKFEPIEIMIFEIYAAPLHLIQRWELVALSLDIMIATLLCFGIIVCFLGFIFLKDKVFYRMGIFLFFLAFLFYMLNGVLSGLLGQPIFPHPFLVKLFWVEILLCVLTGWWTYNSFVKAHFTSVKWKLAPYTVGGAAIIGTFTPYMVTVVLSLTSLVIATVIALKILQEKTYEAGDLGFLAFALLFEHLSVLFAIAPVLGLYESTPFSLHVVPIANLFVALGLFSVLGSNIRSSVREKEELLRIISGQAPVLGSEVLQAKPFGKMIEQVNHEVSIVFIDIVDFSIAAKQFGRRETFDRLADWSSNVRQIIRSHGGEIDRSLGDGLLAFFGFHSKDPRQHATQAFLSAIEIQKQAVEALSKGITGFPVRIGIHTDDVTIGNLGGASTDHTMIGDAVNFASRLENACNSFRITISAKTHAYLDPKVFDTEGMDMILINVKHHQGFVQAYQYNHFFKPEYRERLKQAEIKHFESMKKAVKQDRHEVGALTLQLKSPDGTLNIYDFSKDGFGAEGDTMFGPRSRMQMTLESSSAYLNQFLKAHLMHEINVEIRWSRQTQHSYRHGVLLVLSDSQKTALFEELRKAVSEKETDTVGSVS